MPSKHPLWAANRLLNFINSARSAKEIYENPKIQDDPKEGSSSGYVIGEKTAQKIIDFRTQTPYRRYRTIEELFTVPGLGEDKLNDLLFSFSDRADSTFIDALFANLLGENWDIKPQSIDYEDASEFNLMVNNGENFRKIVAKLYSNLLSGYSSLSLREIEIKVHRAHQENYFDAHLGAFQFAFWWYLFDYDNWFSYQTIKEACEQYLSHHGTSGETIQFRTIHLGGYEAVAEHRKGMILPVVVNFIEKRITLWHVVLND